MASKRSHGHPEADLQRTLVRWLELALPAEAWFTAIDHSGRGARAGGIAKGMGVKRGIFDLVIFYPPIQRVLWLELKSRRGVLSQEQRHFHEIARGCGHHAWPVRSIEEAHRALVVAGIPSRVRVATREPARGPGGIVATVAWHDAALPVPDGWRVANAACGHHTSSYGSVLIERVAE